MANVKRGLTARHEKACRMLVSGRTCGEVARCLDVSATAVSTWLSWDDFKAELARLRRAIEERMITAQSAGVGGDAVMGLFKAKAPQAAQIIVDGMSEESTPAERRRCAESVLSRGGYGITAQIHKTTIVDIGEAFARAAAGVHEYKGPPIGPGGEHLAVVEATVVECVKAEASDAEQDATDDS